MQFALCNEVLREMPFEAQCSYAAALGYAGLEVAPFTLSDEPHRIGAAERTRIRRAAEAAGLRVTGLHWLLVKPEELSITTPDVATHARTRDVLIGLVDLCAELGGSVMVHGSPAQRRIGDSEPKDARKRAIDIFAAVAERAEAAGVVYCLEPLSRHEADFVNTVADAVAVAEEIGRPKHFRTMIDTSAAGLTEEEPVPDLIRRWVPTGWIGHVQLNDTNRRAPGQGGDDFTAILGALSEVGFGGIPAVEPFVYEPDGPATAARAIGYLQGIAEALP